jgi:hypothetical protein
MEGRLTRTFALNRVFTRVKKPTKCPIQAVESLHATPKLRKPMKSRKPHLRVADAVEGGEVCSVSSVSARSMLQNTLRTTRVVFRTFQRKKTGTRSRCGGYPEH